MNPFTLLGLAAHPEFQQGALVGGVAALLLFFVKAPGWLPTWGVAAFLALAWTGRLASAPDVPSWALAVSALAALAGGWAIHVMLRRAPGWAVGFVFALWVLGVWGTVPDTERAVVIMGVAAGMLPLLWPGLDVPIRSWGALAAVPALGFVTATDGAARSSAMVGAFGMVGMIVVAAALLAARRDVRLPAGALVAAQVVHVIVSGRVAGQMESSVAALLAVVASALVTGGALVGSVRRRRPPGRPPEPEPRVAATPHDRGSRSRTPLLTGFERPRRKR